MLIFFFFKGWDTLATLLTCLFAISYSTAPLCMASMRRQLPDFKRTLKLPFGYVWAYFAFLFCTFFIYWCGWEIVSKVGIFLFCCLIVIYLYHIFNPHASLEWSSSVWMWYYFIGLILISLIGEYGTGLHLIHGSKLIYIISFHSFITITLGVIFKSPSEKLKNIVEEIQAKINSKK